MVRPVSLAAAVVAVLAFCTGPAWAASGRVAYNEHTSAMVTAARYLPAGTVLRLTNPETGHCVTVVVNDRGPFNGGRIFDLSTGAFSALFGGLGRGVGEVQYSVVRAPHGLFLAFRGGHPRHWRHHRSR